jgi:hypothetical protein
MKTLFYNTVNEIRVGMMVVVFTMAIFATIKVRELQLNDVNKIEMLRANAMALSSAVFPASSMTDAKLIEEPVAINNPLSNENHSVIT